MINHAFSASAAATSATETVNSSQPLSDIQQLKLPYPEGASRDAIIDLTNKKTEALANMLQSRKAGEMLDLSATFLQQVNLSAVSNKNLSFINFSRAVLSNTDLTNVDLSHTVLDNADLSYSNIENVILQQTSMENTRLAGVALSWNQYLYANDHSADLTDFKRGEAKVLMGGVNFGPFTYTLTPYPVGQSPAPQGLMLLQTSTGHIEENALATTIINRKKTTIDEIMAAPATFSDKYRNLQGADLSHIDLKQKYMPRVILRQSNLQLTDLSEGNFTASKFGEAQLSATKFRGAILDGAEFNFAGGNLDCEGASAIKTEFIGAELVCPNFYRTNLQKAEFNGSRLYQPDFREAELGGVNFRGAKIHEADFRNAELTDADFDEAELVNPVIDEKWKNSPIFANTSKMVNPTWVSEENSLAVAQSRENFLGLDDKAIAEAIKSSEYSFAR